MAQQKTNWLLLLGVAGLGYYLYNRSQATTAAAPATSPSLPPAAAPSLTVQSPVVVQANATPLTGQPAPSVTTVPGNIDPTVYATVQQWAASFPNAQGVQQFFQAAVPSEFATLYILITHDWPTCGGSCDSTSEAAWNAIVNKYGGILAGW